MFAHNFGWMASGIVLSRFFVLNTMWTWLLTYELGIVPSLRDRTHKRYPTRHFRAGLQLVPSLRDLSGGGP